MASLVITGVGAGLAAAYPTAAAAINLIAAAAATAAYAYVDQPYIIPALFGEESTKDQNRVGNLKLPTTNPGEPRYRVYGREAYVPAHFLWIKNQKVLVSSTGGGSGKGATAISSVSERFSDIGLAACDGPIMNIVSAMANRAVFYGERSSSESVFVDPRVSMSSQNDSPYYGTRAHLWTSPSITSWGTDPKKSLLYVAVDASFGVTESLGDHFDAGDIVELFSVGEGDQEFQSYSGGGGLRRGVYSVYFVGRDAGYATDFMSLLPLAAQLVSSLPGGVLRLSSEQEPVIIRRVDESICGHTCNINTPYPDTALGNPGDLGFSRHFDNSAGLGSLTFGNFQIMAYASDPNVNPSIRPQSFIKIEVHGGCGGYIESEVTPAPPALPYYPRNPYSAEGYTKLASSRLIVGNTYELQGFCNYAGDVSNVTIVAKLNQVLYPDISATGYGNSIAGTINNSTYDAGDKYILYFLCYTDEIQYVMDSVSAGGNANGDTQLYPGNGQFVPYHHHVNSSSAGGNLGSVVDLSTPASPTTDLTQAKVEIGNPDLIDRTGGASPSDKGGLGDVAFCILPPRVGSFTYRTSRTGTNIGPQGAEFNTGSPDQAALTNADGIAHRGLAHVSFTDLNLYQFGNAIPQTSFKVRESESKSVGDIVTSMIEEVAPYGSVTPGFSSYMPAYGYSVSGGTPTKQAIQPLAVAFGFSMQERAGKLAMLQDSELPIVDVPATKLNARSYKGSDSLMTGLRISQIDSDDLPQRVVVKYLAIGSGNEEARAAGIRSPDSRDSGGRDTIEYNLRPIVMTDGYAKTRAQELLNKSRTESSTSSTVLPPSRMDVMPGHVISTSSNNSAHAAPDAVTSTSVRLSDRKGEVIPGSVSIQLRMFQVTGSFGGGNYSEEFISANLVDDGLGSLIGAPDGITVTSTVDYTGTGQWLIATVTTASTYIVDPLRVPISYKYYATRTWRASKATLGGYDFSVATQLVSTSHDHTFPSHQHSLTFELPPFQSEGGGVSILDPAEDPSINGPWGDQPEIGLSLFAPNSSGATVYESEDGVSDWTEIGQIFGSSIASTIEYITDTNQNTVLYMPRWEVGSTVESWVDYNTQVTTKGTPWPIEKSGTVTVREVIEGKHNFLINGEVVGATTVLNAGDLTVLQGLIRGLRGTRYASDRHVVGDAVLYLPHGDGTGVGHFTPSLGHAGTLTQRNLRAVVPGSTLSLASTQIVRTTGVRASPGAPIVDEHSLTLIPSSDAANPNGIKFKWDRPPTAPTPIFGVDPMPSTYNEQYEVYAFIAADINPLSTGLDLDEEIINASFAVWYAGNQGSGATVMIDREIIYTRAQQLADGFIIGSKISFMCFAVSPSGRGPRCYPKFDEASIVVPIS